MEEQIDHRARVFIVGYKGSDHLLEKCLASAEATGNDTSKWILVRTDGSDYDSPHRKLILDLPQGNPVSVNRAFAEVAKICYNNQDNFVFLDADCTFLKPEAIERLTFELIGRQGTMLGQPHWVTNDIYHGWLINGNSAYTWECYHKFGLERFPIPDDEPFDIFLSRKFYGTHMAPTGLFAMTESMEECKDLDEFLAMFDQAVIQHACSDGTLADLVIERYGKKEPEKVLVDA